MNNRQKIIQDYIKRTGVDPNHYTGSARYFRDKAIRDSDVYKRTRKYQLQWEENEAKAKKRDADKLLREIQKFRKENTYDPETERLSNLLDKYRGYYGTNVNQPVSKADLNNFDKYMRYKNGPQQQQAKQEKHEEENNWIEKLLRGNAEEFDDPDRGGLLGVLDKTLGRVSHQANKTILGDMYVDPSKEQIQKNPLLKEAYSKPDNAVEKGSDIAGVITGYTAPIGGAYKYTAKGAEAGYKGINGLIKFLNQGKGITKGGKYVNDAVKGATAMGAYSGAREGLSEFTTPDSATLGERLKRVGIETAGGAVGDPLARLVGTGIKEGAKYAIGGPKRALQEQIANEGIKPLQSTLDKLRPKPEQKLSELVESLKTHQEPPTYKPVLEGLDATKQKDITSVNAFFQDVYRNFKEALGSNYPRAKKLLLDPFDKSKKENVDLQKAWLNDLDKTIVKGLGIKKGSKLSKLVQDYGEGTIDLNTLKQQAPNDWQKVVKADEWFRNAYDTLLNQVNGIRSRIYPNNPDKLVPFRKDYYRHFRELNGLEGFINMFDTPAGIDPSLVGTSEWTKPNTKWASFAQKRGLGTYKSDAVGGFLDYLPAATYAIKIDPHIPKFKAFTDELRETTNGNLNNFINFLDKFTQDLSGKTNFIDRPFQDILGRRTFRILHTLNSHVKKNMILGNLGSALAQLANIPNGIAYSKGFAIPGAKRTLLSLMGDADDAIKQSGFLAERYGHSMYNNFETGILKNAEKFAGWALETVDKVGTSFIWNSVYEKALAQNIADPIQYADEITRNLIAGRGIGEVPLGQKSKLFQLIAPFQLEVANLWKVQKDFMKEKDFVGLIGLYLGSYILNKGMEEVRGSGVTFDPIDAIIDAMADEDLSAVERAGRLGGEILSNVPLGQTFANQYPEYGLDMFGYQSPTREQLFGDNDPTRFGDGLTVSKGFQDPFYKLLPPFGGAQLEKTVQGISGLKQEGVFNHNDNLKYPVDPNAWNSIKGALFGQSAFNEAQDYYNNDRSPLTANMTQEYLKAQEVGRGKEYYDSVVKKREMDKLLRFIKELKGKKNLSNKEENKLEKLTKELSKYKAVN